MTAATIKSGKKHVDAIVIGQGLCGTFLSYYLIKAGKSVLVIDKAKPFTATKAASGVINPVTGRRIVRTWRIEELLPFALNAYNEFGAVLGKELVQQVGILDFHPTQQMKEAFDNRLPQETEYLHRPHDETTWKTFFHFNYGIGEISPCLLIDLLSMLDLWREQLSQKNALLEEQFSWEKTQVNNDHIVYGDIVAEKIFCCEGVEGFDNPYFKNLPYSRMKGEVVIAKIPGLPRNNIYKQGLNIVPWKDDLFWIGSSYEWKFEDLLPTEAYRQKVELQLNNWLKPTYTIVDHFASERPANMERRPFVGLHPQHPSIGILNGMGTKGCSLAPFFAKQLVDHLINKTAIYPDADVKRFERTLQR